MASHLHAIPLTAKTVHLCIDMQLLFANDTPWHTPWMGRVLPVVAEIAGRHCRAHGVDTTGAGPT